MPFSTLIRESWSDFRRSWRVVLLFQLAFKALAAIFFTLVSVQAAEWLIERSGKSAVTNIDLINFVLTPSGAALAILMGLGMFASTLLEHAGVLTVVAMKLSGQSLTLRHVTLDLATVFVRILRLGLVQLVLWSLALAPFVVLAGITYALLLTAYDINAYLAEKPPEFLVAVGIGVGLFVLALALGAWLYVRWAFVLPILVFEGGWVIPALRKSGERVRGAGWRVGSILLGWQVLALTVAAVLVLAFKYLAGFLIGLAGTSPQALVPTTAFLLATHGILLLTLSSVEATVHCLLLRRLYIERSIAAGVPVGDRTPVKEDIPAGLSLRAMGALAVAFLGTVGFLAWGLSDRLDVKANVEVAAHRGGARLAPENTLAAIRDAIRLGADYAEIDVQETKDGIIVVAHDNDLMRLAKVPKRIRDMTYEEARQIDIGSHFGPEYASERIATLKEAIDTARGKIKLNIELKSHGKDQKLSEGVARLLRDEDFDSDCIVASLDYDAVREARKHNPRLKIAAIITATVGEITRLDVDVLEINEELATEDLVRKARAANKEVHVWTVNDPEAMLRFFERGVTCIITDDPAEALRIRAERANLSDAERMLLASRGLLELKR